jgi:hypothetical protein
MGKINFGRLKTRGFLELELPTLMPRAQGVRLLRNARGVPKGKNHSGKGDPNRLRWKMDCRDGQYRYLPEASFIEFLIFIFLIRPCSSGNPSPSLALKFG